MREIVMQVRTIGICDFVDILEDHPAYEIEQVGEFQLWRLQTENHGVIIGIQGCISDNILVIREQKQPLMVVK